MSKDVFRIKYRKSQLFNVNKYSILQMDFMNEALRVTIFVELIT